MVGDNSIGRAYLKVRPDFQVIKKYIYEGLSEVQLKRRALQFEKELCKLYLPYITKSESLELEQSLNQILNKPSLSGHQENLKFIILTLFNQFIEENDFVRLNNQQSSKRVDHFITQFGTLFQNESKRFRISFQEKDDYEGKSAMPNGKRVKITFTDELVTDWIIKTLRDSITQQNVPLSIGTQLFDAHIVASTHDRKYQFYKKDIPLGAFEFVEPETIYTETVAHLCAPVLNYLNGETFLKKESQKYWSMQQLGFLVEVLITVGFYESKDGRNYQLGKKNPPIADKKYLQRTLENKIKQGFLTFYSGTQTFGF